MMQFGLISIGAGAATALLFASVASGSLISIILFYLAPLPIMIAAIGWSHWAGLVAVVVAGGALLATLGATFFIAFLIGTGFPAWLLGYLTMLARPAPAGAPDAVEWYPPGRLVLWAALLATLVVVVAILNLGTDIDAFRDGLRKALDRLIVIGTEDGGKTGPTNPNVSRFVDFLIAAIPPGAAVLATVTNTLNLWLAARIVRFSGLLRRPWPDLPAMTLPPMASILLAAAIAASLVGNMIGLLGGSLLAALLMAYAVLGFAVLHSLTRGLSSRPFLLGGTYAVVVTFGWPAIALCLLGLLETALSLRSRFGAKPPPAVQ